MATRVLRPGSRAVLISLGGQPWRPLACWPALRSALPKLDGRRRSSQLPPGPQGAERLTSVSTEKRRATNSSPKTNFEAYKNRKGVKEVVDVSDGTSGYKVLSTSSSLSFYHSDERAAGKRGFILSNTWLRDNCRCPKCVNQETMQKSFNIFASPLPTPPAQEVQIEQRGIRVTWTHELHESFYDWAFIRHYLDNKARALPSRNRQLWGAEIKENPPTVTFAEVMDSESGVAKMTGLIRKFGLVFVNDTPFDDSIHTKKLLERIGPIRETHYGGFYDFIPDMAKADTAYTNIALAAHTDTTYFTDPAGLQAFHLLSHTPSPGEPDATGGESLLVDGFNAAEKLRESDRALFYELARRGLPWHASGNEGVTITPDQLYSVIELENDRETVQKIRWNNDDRGVLPLPKKSSPADQMLWYDAASKWEQILRSKESEYWFQLKPGTIVIFDNHRVLHGRSAFTGLRRICGGYISMDDFVSRWRNTNLPREEVLAQVIG